MDLCLCLVFLRSFIMPQSDHVNQLAKHGSHALRQKNLEVFDSAPAVHKLPVLYTVRNVQAFKLLKIASKFDIWPKLGSDRSLV